jgi:centrosomal CEP192-like protein/ASPM-SPD-2-Hydin domain-containing protein
MFTINYIDQYHRNSCRTPRNPRATRGGASSLPAWPLRQLGISPAIFLAIITTLAILLPPCTVALSAATPSLVQATASAALGTPTTLSLAFPSNTQAGDLLLVAFDYDSSSSPTSVTDSQGNVFTEVGSQLNSPGGGLSRVYYAKNIKGGADTVKVTLSASSSYLELYLNEYSGINTTNPIDAEVGASGNAGAVSSGSVTTTAAGDIIYGYCLGDWACTVGSGFTARSTLNGNLIEDETAGSAGSYAATGSANNGWTMQMVALKPASASVPGPAPAPAASLSPTSLTFASLTVGATSSVQTVTLSNTGNAALSITGISITGADPSDFKETNGCGSSIAAGASCTISITFTPAASGSLSAALTVTATAVGDPSVGLTGTGTSGGGGGGTGSTPSVTLSTASLAFGSQPVDTTSSAQTITLSNTGSAALSITSLAITGTNASNFAEVGNTCGSSVAAGGTCTVAVTYTPSADSSSSATLTITDNASGSPQSVSLSGTGSHDVILSWTASTSSGVVGYNVYRGTTSGGESSTPLNSSPINGATFTDSNVTAGQAYYYVIMAVNSSDALSGCSNEASVAVP